MVDILIILSGARIFFLCFFTFIVWHICRFRLRSRYFARCFHIVESTLRISPCQKEFNRGSIQLQSRLYHVTIFHHCVRYHLLYCTCVLLETHQASTRAKAKGGLKGPQRGGNGWPSTSPTVVLVAPATWWTNAAPGLGPKKHSKRQMQTCSSMPQCSNADFFSADSQKVFRLCRHLHAAVPQGSWGIWAHGG